METNNKLFSVIVLAYNNTSLLTDALDSVLSQCYPAVELIIADDGTSGFPREEIEQYITQHKGENLRRAVVYSNGQNLGTVKSANGALLESNGEYIKFLAADDALYDEHTLENAAQALSAHPGQLVIGDVMRCDDALRPVGMIRKHLVNSINDMTPLDCFRRLCVHNDIPAPGVFFHRSFFTEQGLFDESYRLLEDWPAWLRAAQTSYRFFYSPFSAVCYRTNGGVGTGSHPDYLRDKRRVLNIIIRPSKKELGIFWYLLSQTSFHLINSPIIRKAYALVFRRNRFQ